MSTSLTFDETSRYLTTASGDRLHYHEAGAADAMPLVLLHGGGAGSMAWTQFCKNLGPLSRHFHVLAFDLPQYGRSCKPIFKEPTYEGCARILGEALQELSLDRMHIAGVSQGGGVACLLAHQLPDLVDKLVLVSPGGIFDSILTPVPMDTLRDTFEYYNPGPQTKDRLKSILRRMVYNESVLTDEIIEMRWEASIDPESIEAMRNFGTAGLGDVTSILPDIHQRTLILWGVEDRVLPLDTPLQFLKRMPNADSVMLSKVGHWIPFERHNTFNQLLQIFLTHGSLEAPARESSE